MQPDSARDLITFAAREAHYVSRFVAEHMPAFSRSCADQELRKAVESYIDTSRENVARNERILTALEAEPSGDASPGIEGLVSQLERAICACPDDETRDIALERGVEAVRIFDRWRITSLKVWGGAFDWPDVCDIASETLSALDDVGRSLASVERRLVVSARSA